MVREIHKLVAVDEKTFHRHYNLAPWVDDTHRNKLELLAEQYRQKAL